MILNILIMIAVLGWLLAIRFYQIIRELRMDIIKIAILRGIHCENITPEEWARANQEVKKEMDAIDHPI